MQHPFIERVTGVEPATLGLGSRCSTTELHPQTDAKVIILSENHIKYICKTVTAEEELLFKHRGEIVYELV